MSDQIELFQRDSGQHMKVRVFFALQPDAAAAEHIARLVSSLRHEYGFEGAAIERARLHVTLYYVGEYPVLRDPVLLAAECAAATVRGHAFDVSFDRVRSFATRPGNSPLVLIASDGAPQVERLRRSLAQALQIQGIAREQAPTPHLTLLYDRRSLQETPIEPIRWRASEFVLVKSLHGPGKHVGMGRWPLA